VGEISSVEPQIEVQRGLQAHRRSLGPNSILEICPLDVLFTVDARTLWIRRGEPVTSDGFKESGREMIGVMLQTRISDGECWPTTASTQDLTQDANTPREPAVVASPRFTGSRGTFPIAWCGR